MVSPMVRLHFTLMTLKEQCQGHSDLEGLYLIKEPDRPYVTIKQ